MAFKLNHVHLKTPDPDKTAQFYVDNLGAKIVGEIDGRGLRLDLHGLALNVTRVIEGQTREQTYGIEHIAIDTDDMPGVIDKLTDAGARLLEETTAGDDRRVCFFEGPEGSSWRCWRWPANLMGGFPVDSAVPTCGFR